MKRAFAIILSVLVVACVPKSMLQPQYSGSDSATIKISSEFSVTSTYIDIDGDPVAVLDCEKETAIKVSPGVHIMAVKAASAWVNINSPSRKVEISQGETKYYIVKAIPFVKTISIHDASKNEFDKLIAKGERF